MARNQRYHQQGTKVLSGDTFSSFAAKPRCLTQVFKRFSQASSAALQPAATIRLGAVRAHDFRTAVDARDGLRGASKR